MESATVTSKGQVTLPVGLRTALDIRTGDKVIFEKENRAVVLKVEYRSRDPVSVLEGCLAGISKDAVSAKHEISGYMAKRFAKR